MPRAAAARPTRPRGRWLRWLVAALLVFLAVDAALGIAYLARVTAVPDVVGRADADAIEALESAGLTVGQTYLATSGAAPGTVLGQRPSGGSRAAKGSRVTLSVAEAQVTVPDVVGLRSEEASRTLSRAGLRMEVAARSGRRAGIVVGQDPRAGEQRAFDSAVTVELELVR